MLLYPDQRVTNQPENETCVFGAPIEKCDWMVLYARAKTLPQTQMKYLILKDDGGETTAVYFMRNGSEITDRVCLLLRNLEDADTCLESAAWVRIQENFPGMIYIVDTTETADRWQTYNAAIGASEESICMVDFDLEKF